jgi:hypothetical protein
MQKFFLLPWTVTLLFPKSSAAPQTQSNPNLCWCCFVLCALITSNWKMEYCFLGTRLACECIGCGFVGGDDNHCQWTLECYPWLVNLSEMALSRLDTQWGFRDNTPVEGRCVFTYAGILIKELCMSQSQHLNHSRGASIQTLDIIQLHCHLQLRMALWNTVVNTTLVLYHFKS